MRLKEDLEVINGGGGATYFGYVNMTMFPCPPFVMFSNGDDCGVCWTFRVGRDWEVESLALWCKLVPLATAVIDLGAREGAYSLTAAALRNDIQIHSFEPNPDSFARLLINLNANDFKNLIPHREAIGHKAGVVKFGWVPKSLGHLSSGGRLGGYTHPSATELYVKMLSLDEALEGVDLGQRPLIKIDIEGAEQLAFQGMPRILGHKPDIILETFETKTCAYVTELTKPLGYNYFFIDEANRRIEQRAQLQPGDPKGNMNQLLTTRSPEAVLSLA